jgi:hypothetical protein
MKAQSSPYTIPPCVSSAAAVIGEAARISYAAIARARARALISPIFPPPGAVPGAPASHLKKNRV